MTDKEKEILSRLTYEVIGTTIGKEKDKACYWFKKQADKMAQQTMRRLDREILQPNKHHVSADWITYQGEHFMWAYLYTRHKGKNGIIKRSDDIVYIYGEGNDLGMIFGDVRTFQGENYDLFIIFTSEFFGRMERDFLLQDNPDRMETIRQFVAHNPELTYDIWSDENDNPHLAIAMFDSYVATGRVDAPLPTRWVMTHFIISAALHDNMSACKEDPEYIGFQITDEHERNLHTMAERLAKNTENFYKSDKPNVDVFEDAIEPELMPIDYYYHLTNDVEYKIGHASNPDFMQSWYTVVTIVGDLVMKASGMAVMLPVVGKEDEYIRFFACEVLKVLEGSKDVSLSELNDFFLERIAKAATKILWHRQYDITLEDVTAVLKELKLWNIAVNRTNERLNLKRYIMDKKMKEQLRRIMKKYGLRDKYLNLIKDTRITVEAYLDWVESIYAISRLHPYITNEKDKPKFLAADKDWLEYIVNEDKFALLDEYIQRHTKSVVIQAIHYLMDNGIWTCPLGNEGIRKSKPEFYEGLKAIDDAVEYLRTEGLLKTEEQTPAKAEEPEVLDFDIEEEPVTGKRNKAQELMDSCSDLQKQLYENFVKLKQYFDQDDLTELFEKENQKLEKQNKDLSESIKVVNQQYSDAKKEVERLKQVAHDAKKEANQAAINFTKLQEQYDKVKGELDFLRKESQKAQETPKAKIIPYSKMRALPLIGDGAMSVLTPFLKSYNIVIDEKK